MDALRNILVLMEPAAERQPAFDAALLLAKAFKAHLHLLLTDYRDLQFAYYDPMTLDVQRFQDSVMGAHRSQLDRHVQDAAAAGVTATPEVLWGWPFHEIALERIGALRPDLVVKRSTHHTRIERTIFTGSDWHLIRDCPAPLLLVKDAARFERPRILTCVDPQHSHDKPAALDHKLLRSAALLAEALRGEVHALHVFALPYPVAVVGEGYIAAYNSMPDEQSLEAVNASLRDLLAAHPAARGHAHLRVGEPSRDIVEEARELDADLVVMGAVSRRRLQRWLIGNTAEAVLDRLPCNVWVEKPAQGN